MTNTQIIDAIRFYLSRPQAEKKLVLEQLELNEINRLADSLLIDKRRFDAQECCRRWEESLDNTPRHLWGR